MDLTTREKRKQHAAEHFKKMAEQYADQISNSVRVSQIFNAGAFGKQKTKTKISIVDKDSVTAAFDERAKSKNGRIAILNFASYEKAGGSFLEGSGAQEEALCHRSTLYNILNEFDSTFYDENRKNPNRNLWINRMLYTPSVTFFDDSGTASFDVITCAAPDYRSAKAAGVTREENSAALGSRIYYLLQGAQFCEVDTLILGAFGCGVFEQDPIEVARFFKNALANMSFRKAVFAIPGGPNLEAFRYVFEEEKI